MLFRSPFNVWPLHERNVCLSLYLVGIVGREDSSEREHCIGFWLIQDFMLFSLRVMLLGGEPIFVGCHRGQSFQCARLHLGAQDLRCLLTWLTFAFEDWITSLYLANLLLLVRKIFCMRLHFSMLRLVTSFFLDAVRGVGMLLHFPRVCGDVQQRY